MRNGVVVAIGVIILLTTWGEIIAGIAALLSIIGVAIVYMTLIACVVGFIALLMGFDGQTGEPFDNEPVYHG